MTIARIPILLLALVAGFTPANAADAAASKANKALNVIYPGKKAATNFNALEPSSGNDRVDSAKVMIPPLVELQRSEVPAGLIERSELPNLKIPPSTQKILNTLPHELGEPQKRLPKGKANMDREIFTGEKDPDSYANVSGKDKAPALEAAKPKFDIQMNDTKPDQKLEVLAQASRAYTVGQYETAVALFKRVLASDKKNRDALFGIATSYHKNGQKPQAKMYYAKLLDAYPQDTEGQNNFLSLVAEEAPSDALVQFDALIKVNPDYAPLHAHKAMVYTRLGDDVNAIKNFATALKFDPNNNSYRYNLAVLLDKNKDYDNAYILYNQLLEESYRGNFIPTNRKQLIDRITFVSAKTTPGASSSL